MSATDQGDRLCTDDGCERKHYARGWCKPHYKREAARQQALSGHRKTLRNLSPAEVVVARRRVTESGCWEWQGARDPKGYGRLGYQGAQYLAHRFSFELVHGPVADEMTLDHLCRNTSCVNPAHLEVVTRSENSTRAWLARAS